MIRIRLAGCDLRASTGRVLRSRGDLRRGVPGRRWSGDRLRRCRPGTHHARRALSVVPGSIETRDLWQEQEIAVSPTNQQVVNHAFLRGMYEDGYFPDRLVDKAKAILLRLCERIEAERPSDLAALYVLTEAATEEFNALEAEFVAAGSEIETVAREVIAGDFWFVASAYGFAEADVEELVAARDW